MTGRKLDWAPALLMSLGAMATVGVDTQQAVHLRRPLGEVIPRSLNGWSGQDLSLSEPETTVSGVSEYLLRSYEERADSAGDGIITLYVGYYDRQLRGKIIHSPKNCMPGSGWDALQSGVVNVNTPSGPSGVNRYLLQSKQQLALVLYWYQGRGRVQSSEYMVKLDLLQDAALHKRTEEALVRIIVPITESIRDADSLATLFASTLIPQIDRALPIWR